MSSWSRPLSRLRDAAMSPSTVSSILVVLLLACLFAVAALQRLSLDMSAPLWIDEVYTAIYTKSSSISSLYYDLRKDVSGPLYHFMMWFWDDTFGDSNISLRYPSLILSVITPCLVIIWGPSDRFLKWSWAALLAAWTPVMWYGAEARPYALLLGLATGQAIVYLKLFTSNSRMAPALWCLISSGLILTHLHSVVIIGLQFVGYCATRPREARKHAWTLMLFIPSMMWLIPQLPVFVRFADPSASWQQTLSLSQGLGMFNFLLGLGRIMPLVALAVGATLLLAFSELRHGVDPSARSGELILTATAIGAAMLLIGAGMMKPFLVERYLVPMAPGILFGVALAIAYLRERVPLLAVIILAAYLGSSVLGLRYARANPTRPIKYAWNWEWASDYLRSRQPERVFFVWDHPNAKLHDPAHLSRLGSYFFERDGFLVPVNPVVFGNQDRSGPAAEISSLADRPGDALIWVAYLDLKGTHMTPDEGALLTDRFGWQCQKRVQGPYLVFACERPER